jgi:hypothetical protein
LVGIGSRVTYSATVLDSSGDPIPGAGVTWTVSEPEIADITASGMATARRQGIATVQARSGTASGFAKLEVYLPPDVGEYQPGVRYTGRLGYTEYVPGSLPIVLSAPHGGDREPDEIPDRAWGTTVTDRNTAALAETIADALEDRTGQRPHLVISRLKRTKLDPNREMEEAAQGSPHAELAWAEYHGFIDEARSTTATLHGAGLYLDIHGHGHEIARVELGYLLGSSTLELPDDVLDQGSFAQQSSIRALAEGAPGSFAELLRGASSFGGLLQASGYRAVPSPSDPDPGGAPYFSGGYSTARHGSRDGGSVNGIQLEHPYEGVRDSQESRAGYAEALADVILAYLSTHESP